MSSITILREPAGGGRWGLESLVACTGLLAALGGCSQSSTTGNPYGSGATSGGTATGTATTGGTATGSPATTLGGTTATGVTTAAGPTAGGTTAGVTSVGVTSAGLTTGATTAGATAAGATTTGATTCTPEETQFSFFLTSRAALVRESGNADGFGGNLGGITGADQICTNIAVYSTPCAAQKTWRAFLSTSTEDAIDRIGQGPWYDRVGHLLANNVSELVVTSGMDERGLTNADAAIRDDLPNEDGIPNHSPEGVEVDNHQILTGSGLDGRLYTQSTGTGTMGSFGGNMGGTSCNDGEWSIQKATCWDWTTSDAVGCPRVGHSWPRDISGINWISVWNEGGCAPGGVLDETVTAGPDGTARVGSAGGYGGFYCFAVTGQ